MTLTYEEIDHAIQQAARKPMTESDFKTALMDIVDRAAHTMATEKLIAALQVHIDILAKGA